ncbi:hypothetical protein G7047_16115 [Diaphorobacter sp. HDW4A]|uniref:hypothetical protein n=1 Tax=Diaphorobacter sp. HDW4A TaxID=2714924 RepID=UPI001407DF18|nr:hypothetical protein [Diaphorobacter sp. HDW4A]QIL81265.1 hypothetical protein G7047_16115 [Diaphorobacter sp. HDW4A]
MPSKRVFDYFLRAEQKVIAPPGAVPAYLLRASKKVTPPPGGTPGLRPQKTNEQKFSLQQ